MGSTVRCLVLVSAIAFVLSIPCAQAEERTYHYTVPNATTIDLGRASDTYRLRAGDEVTISWRSDVDLFSFTITCDEFRDEYAIGYLVEWTGEYSIENDCTVFVEWVNDKDVPAVVELTIETETSSMLEDERTRWALLTALAVIIVTVVAIGLRRRADEAEQQPPLEVVAVGSSTVPGADTGPACPRCGVENPPGVEFCRGCGRPTEAFRKVR